MQYLMDGKTICYGAVDLTVCGAELILTPSSTTFIVFAAIARNIMKCEVTEVVGRRHISRLYLKGYSTISFLAGLKYTIVFSNQKSNFIFYLMLL